MLQGRLVEGRKIVTLASMNFPPLVSSVFGSNPGQNIGYVGIKDETSRC